MRASKTILVAAFCALLLPVAAYAADDGQTQPRLSYGDVNGTQTADLVPTTNGSGNVKGIQCSSYDWGYSPTITAKITVNGGTVQNLTIDFDFFPGYNTGFIPMNVRFSSSIRIQIQGGFNWSGHNGTCVASWALD